MLNVDSYGNVYFPAEISVANYPITLETPTYVLVPGLGGKLSKVALSTLTGGSGSGGGSIGSSVTSVFGRDGDIVPVFGDYTTDQIKEEGNLFFTPARARNSISLTTVGLSGPATYNSITGVLNIPNYQNGVSKFNGRTGDVVLTALDITTALTYTPLAVEADPIWTAQKILYYTKVESDNLFALKTHTHTSAEIIAGLGYTPSNDNAVVHIAGTETITGAKTFTSDIFISGINPRLYFTDTDNNPDYFISNTDGTFTVYDVSNSIGRFKIYSSGVAEFTNSLTANSFIKSGGLSSEFLKADGSVDSNVYATQTYVGTQITNLINGAPAALDTLNELAVALGNDANFATTVTNLIGTKEPAITAGTTSQVWRGDKTWQTIATILGYTPADDLNVVKLTGTQNIGGVKYFDAIARFNFGAAFLDLFNGGYTNILGTTGGLNIGVGAQTHTLLFPTTLSGYTYTFPANNGTIALTSDIPSLAGYVPTSRTLTINGVSYDLSANRSWSIAAGVTSFNTRTGDITLSSADVTGALGYTPYNSTNPNGYITGITSGMVTTALGYTPYNSSNPSGFITSSSLSSYLPLSGGTMTGGLIASAGDRGFEVNASGGISLYSNEINAGALGGTGTIYMGWRRTTQVNVGVPMVLSSSISATSGSFSGSITIGGSLVNNTDGAVMMESNASENNNWLFKENSKAWGLFWFNRGTQAGQTIGTYTTVGAELMFMGGSSGIAMPTGWTGYQLGSNIAVMISNYSGYIYSASTIYAATSMLVAGNTVLHAGNYSSYAVPTSRTITINGTGYDLSADRSWTISASSATQLLSPNGGTVVAADSAMPNAGHSFIHTLAYGPGGNDGHILGMTWSNTTTSYGAQLWLDTDPTNRMAIRSRNSAGTWNGWWEVITEGNIGSQSVNYATSAGSASSASSATTAAYLPTLYAGGVQSNPQTYFGQSVGLRVAMTGSWSTWSDTLWINGYAGGDVLQMCALHTLRNGQPRMAISVQASNSSSYGTYYEFITAYNIASQSVSYASSAGNADTTDGYHVSTSGSANTIPTRNGNGYLSPENWIQLNGIYGLYAPTNSAHFYPNDADYGSWRIAGTRNGWYGIYFDSGTTLMMNSNESGHHRSGYGWQFRWYNGSFYVSTNSYGGGSEYSVIHGGNIGNQSVNYANYSGYTSGYSTYVELAGGNYIWFNGSGYHNVRMYESYGVTINCISSPWNFQVLNGSIISGFQPSGGNYGSGNIYATGDVTAYYSDKRLKHNLNPIENAVAKLSTLTGYTYQHNDLGQKLLGENPNKVHAGLVAQEVQAVLPEVVTIAPFDLDGYDEQGRGVSRSGENYLTIKYERIVPLLIEGIKEQQVQIESQKTEIEELKYLVKQLLNK